MKGLILIVSIFATFLPNTSTADHVGVESLFTSMAIDKARNKARMERLETLFGNRNPVGTCLLAADLIRIKSKDYLEITVVPDSHSRPSSYVLSGAYEYTRPIEESDCPNGTAWVFRGEDAELDEKVTIHACMTVTENQLQNISMDVTRSVWLGLFKSGKVEKLKEHRC